MRAIETGYWPCDEEFSALEGLLFSQMGHLVDYWQEHHPDEVIKRRVSRVTPH
jgi:hypothetical protein